MRSVLSKTIQWSVKILITLAMYTDLNNVFIAAVKDEPQRNLESITI